MWTCNTLYICGGVESPYTWKIYFFSNEVNAHCYPPLILIHLPPVFWGFMAYISAFASHTQVELSGIPSVAGGFTDSLSTFTIINVHNCCRKQPQTTDQQFPHVFLLSLPQTGQASQRDLLLWGLCLSLWIHCWCFSLPDLTCCKTLKLLLHPCPSWESDTSWGPLRCHTLLSPMRQMVICEYRLYK